MSYYSYTSYDAYGPESEYGQEQAEGLAIVTADTEPTVEVSEEPTGYKHSPLHYAFGLVPLADFFIYYKVNDYFSSLSSDDWDSVSVRALGGGVFKLVMLVAHFVVPAVSKNFKFVFGLSTLQELELLYKINSADGVYAYPDVNMVYAPSVFGSVVSLANLVNSLMSKSDEEPVSEQPVEDSESGDAEEDIEVTPSGSGYSGYYGYY